MFTKDLHKEAHKMKYNVCSSKDSNKTLEVLPIKGNIRCSLENTSFVEQIK